MLSVTAACNCYSDGQHDDWAGGAIVTRSISSQEGWKHLDMQYVLEVCVWVDLGMNTVILSKARRARISAHTSCHMCGMKCMQWIAYTRVTEHTGIMYSVTMNAKNNNRNRWWLNKMDYKLNNHGLHDSALKNVDYIYKGRIYCTLIRWFCALLDSWDHSKACIHLHLKSVPQCHWLRFLLLTLIVKLFIYFVWNDLNVMNHYYCKSMFY